MSKRLLVRIYLIVELVLFVGLTITSLTDTPIPSGIFVSLALASMVALAIMVKTDTRVDKILHIVSSSISKPQGVATGVLWSFSLPIS